MDNQHNWLISSILLFCVFTALITEVYSTSTGPFYGDAAYFNAEGITACGTESNDNELIGSIAYNDWTTPNSQHDPLCKKFATVTDLTSGKSVTVEIKDKCFSCRHGDIALSIAAFEKLRPLSVGRFPVKWDFAVILDESNSYEDLYSFL